MKIDFVDSNSGQDSKNQLDDSQDDNLRPRGSAAKIDYVDSNSNGNG